MLYFVTRSKSTLTIAALRYVFLSTLTSQAVIATQKNPPFFQHTTIHQGWQNIDITIQTIIMSIIQNQFSFIFKNDLDTFTKFMSYSTSSFGITCLKSLFYVIQKIWKLYQKKYYLTVNTYQTCNIVHSILQFHERRRVKIRLPQTSQPGTNNGSITSDKIQAAIIFLFD